MQYDPVRKLHGESKCIKMPTFLKATLQIKTMNPFIAIVTAARLLLDIVTIPLYYAKKVWKDRNDVCIK